MTKTKATTETAKPGVQGINPQGGTYSIHDGEVRRIFLG